MGMPLSIIAITEHTLHNNQDTVINNPAALSPGSLNPTSTRPFGIQLSRFRFGFVASNDNHKITQSPIVHWANNARRWGLAFTINLAGINTPID